MVFENKLWIAQSDDKVCILPKMANRHGLIAGATGTGKTFTLKVLAESFSSIGVPVFLADVKGDLGGTCHPGVDSEGMQKRIKKFGLEETFHYRAFPTCFWDIFGKNGLPLRTTVSEMGPTLFARLMGLNDTQEGVLSIVFRIADDSKMLLLDLKDLKALLQYVGDHASEYVTQYGNITKQSVGAVIRSLLTLEEQGGESFFGEPALDINDWIRVDSDGRGVINILHCADLINTPQLYATFMLWMISELFEKMPEVGDCEKPKMVFFFDEAHLLFTDAPKALLQKVEQVVKLIRSKGIGIYFITQSPSDLPDGVLAQLGNRVQHALRAYTPADQKAVKTAAQTFRANPAFATEDVITEMGTGEALVSFLDEEGRPGIVQRSFILCPESQAGAIPDADRQSMIGGNALCSKYRQDVDRESAYELLTKRHEEEEAEEAAEVKKAEEEKEAEEKAKEEEKERKEKEKEEKEEEKARLAKEREKSQRSKARNSSPIGKAASSAMTSIGREVGRNLIRGLFDTLRH